METSEISKEGIDQIIEYIKTTGDADFGVGFYFGSQGKFSYPDVCLPKKVDCSSTASYIQEILDDISYSVSLNGYDNRYQVIVSTSFKNENELSLKVPQEYFSLNSFIVKLEVSDVDTNIYEKTWKFDLQQTVDLLSFAIKNGCRIYDVEGKSVCCT